MYECMISEWRILYGQSKPLYQNKDLDFAFIAVKITILRASLLPYSKGLYLPRYEDCKFRLSKIEPEAYNVPTVSAVSTVIKILQQLRTINYFLYMVFVYAINQVVDKSYWI